MLLPEIKEREYRFKLALRMGLPIFGLILALISHTLISSYQSLTASFYIESILALLFSIYFIFYLIYNGFETKITESVTGVFTREYLFKYIQNEINRKKDYTLILISCDNIYDINTRYGLKNGDKVLRELGVWIGEYLKSKDIMNFPIGHIKGGDFIVGLRGTKNEFSTIMELMCLKSDELKVEDIEVKISGAINDTSYSHTLDYLIENLFEIQEQNRSNKMLLNDDEIAPNELESYVIKALTNKSFIMMKQDVYNNDDLVIKECFVRLKTPQNKLIHPKSYMKILDKLRLMVPFDLMILKNSLLHCVDDDKTIFALNIAPTSIRNHQFLSELKELLKNNVQLKNRVMFILNEREYYSRIDRYRDIIDTLRDLGVLITIDKIGNSHTSFLYFRELNIDAIRFDSHYTKDLHNTKSINVLRGFSAMAMDKGVKTWIKMVESENDKKIFEAIGIDYVQGKQLSSLEKIYEN